jgi:hypothetical protein
MTKLYNDSKKLLDDASSYIIECEQHGQVDLIVGAHDTLAEAMRSVGNAYKCAGLINPFVNCKDM